MNRTNTTQIYYITNFNSTALYLIPVREKTHPMEGGVLRDYFKALGQVLVLLILFNIYFFIYYLFDL